MKTVITAENQWTDPVTVANAPGGRVGLLISGDLSNGSVVTVQVRGMNDNAGDWSDTWLNYATVTDTTITKVDAAAVTRSFDSGDGVVPFLVDWAGFFQVRAGVATGDFGTSDTPTIWF